VPNRILRRMRGVDEPGVISPRRQHPAKSISRPSRSGQIRVGQTRQVSLGSGWTRSPQLPPPRRRSLPRSAGIHLNRSRLPLPES
jgi:hypothetical protein